MYKNKLGKQTNIPIARRLNNWIIDTTKKRVVRMVVNVIDRLPRQQQQQLKFLQIMHFASQVHLKVKFKN